MTEGLERQFEPVEQTDRSRPHRRADLEPIAIRLIDEWQQVLPFVLGPGIDLRELEGNQPAAGFDYLAHHINAYRSVRNLRRNVDMVRTLRQRIGILQERLPAPWYPLAHDDAGDVFHPLHHLDQSFTLVGSAWRESDAAIAHEHPGHAVIRRRRQPVFPRHLTVVMGMDIDETRRHDPTIAYDKVDVTCRDRPRRPKHLQARCDGRSWLMPKNPSCTPPISLTRCNESLATSQMQK
ncbi:MAG TPA: hypothetical protein VMU87_14280 [Stellaceae bacterium]|nr:hypothetical protein [Stellaceae bacterium]